MLMNIGCLGIYFEPFSLIIRGGWFWLDVVVNELFPRPCFWKSVWTASEPCAVLTKDSIAVTKKKKRRRCSYRDFSYLVHGNPTSLFIYYRVVHYAFRCHLNNVKLTLRSKGRGRMECSIAMHTLGWYYVAGRIVCKVNFLCQHAGKRGKTLICSSYSSVSFPSYSSSSFSVNWVERVYKIREKKRAG